MFSLFKRKEEAFIDELTREEEKRVNETDPKYRHKSVSRNQIIRENIQKGCVVKINQSILDRMLYYVG